MEVSACRVTHAAKARKHAFLPAPAAGTQNAAGRTAFGELEQCPAR